MRSPLIQVDELQRLLAGPEPRRPVVLDVRYRLSGPTGRPEFELAHVPGASYVDMDTDLATIRPDGGGGRHPMPSVESFTASMRSAGVTMSRPVIAYDDWSSLPASRVWWMLRHLGFLDVGVLDGGIAAWTRSGHATESGPGAQRVGDFSPSIPGICRLLDAADAMTYAAHGLLLDARPADRFRGENETIDAVAGHIPGAVSAPALDSVDPLGRFLPADQLARRFQELGLAAATGTAHGTGTSDVAVPPHAMVPPDATVTADAPVAAAARTVGTYCGSGVQATHLALALSAAGITDDADVYIGSWSDWITDADRPVALG